MRGFVFRLAQTKGFKNGPWARPGAAILAAFVVVGNLEAAGLKLCQVLVTEHALCQRPHNQVLER